MELGNLTLMDIEKLLIYLFMFNYNTENTPLYSQILEELQRPQRIEEFDK